jgi:HSP20 family protein
MNNLRVFDPLLTDPFESMFSRFLSPTRWDVDNAAPNMRVDVSEVNGSYKVCADIPGVKKDDIHVRIDGNTVQIDAELKQQKDTKGNGGRMLRTERYYGAVSRVFSLADDVDDSKAKAKYEDGVLTLELPKKTTSAAKQLSIQ